MGAWLDVGSLGLAKVVTVASALWPRAKHRHPYEQER